MGLSPAVVWDKTPRDQLSTVLEEELSKIDYPTTPPQYLVVSWKDIRIVKWISYFGNWNLQTGETSEAAAGNYNPGELGINFQRGAVMNRTGGGGLVKDITVLDWSGSQSQSYFMNSMALQLLPKRQHLIVNKVTRQSVLMDRIGYRSVLRMLLTEDPKDPEISKYFKIVVDKLPFARIYEVVQ
jgi:dolichyl-diphosphooligosaccharide--protein glycosyltransferase